MGDRSGPNYQHLNKFLVAKFGISPTQHAVTFGKVIVLVTSYRFIKKNVIFKPKHKWA